MNNPGYDQPLASKLLDDAPIGGSKNNKFGDLDDGGINMDETLEGKIKSTDAKIRVKAFTELLNWSDADYTPAVFSKGLHLTIKEKNSDVIDKMLTAIEDLMEKHPSDYGTVDNKKFISNYAEFLLNNVKGVAKDHALSFITKWWEKGENKNELMELLKILLSTVKIKLQEKTLVIILELLKAGKIEEMQLMKPLYPELEKQIVSRTAAIKNTTYEIYKEAFLWIGEGLNSFIGGLKEAQSKDLKDWMKTVDPKSMKQLKSSDGKGGAKKIDIYANIAEAELPKKYNEEEFTNSIMDQGRWNERKALLDEVNQVLEKNPKLSQKTNCFIYMNLAKRIFMESNIAVQVAVIKTLGYLASGMRKGFTVVAKTIFPVLLGKLKEKNRSLSEEILSTLSKFYLILTFEETADEIEENLKDKNPEKKMNTLNLLFLLTDKLEKIKTKANSVKVVTIVLRMLDENDSTIREKASELIARQVDQFEDKILPKLKDLPTQKMNKIIKYRQTMSSLPQEEVKPGNDKQDAGTENKNDKGGKRNVADKAQMIAKIREELFSNRTVKLSEVRRFGTFLFSNVSGLIELTKEFKEISTAQAHEIYLLIDEIIQKVEKASLLEDTRKVIAQFYIEQLLGKSTPETQASIERYINASSRIMSPKLFLQDILNVLNKGNFKLSKELLSLILTLYEEEVSVTTRLSNIPHALFIDFLKKNFTVPNIHASMKLPLINTMRIVTIKFGEKATNEFPQVLFKELSQQNADLQRAFEKTQEKISGHDIEKKKQALVELDHCTDHARISYFWSRPEFLSFLKSQINPTEREARRETVPLNLICQVISNYLLTKVESPSDFKIKNYLAIFQSILIIHFSPNNEDKQTETDKIVSQTVESLGAMTILNEMITDSNLSANKPVILNFFFEFSHGIEPNLKFMNYISNVVDSKALQDTSLLDLVLLIIKNTHNDEVVIRGSENRYIRDVWQKPEVDLLINEGFVKGNKVFENETTYGMIKNFLISNLRIEEFDFHSYNLASMSFATDVPLKVHLAFYYLRSIENVRSNLIFILKEITVCFNSISTSEEILIALKTVFNILKNLVYMQESETFDSAKDLFFELLQINKHLLKEFEVLVELKVTDRTFYNDILSNKTIIFSPMILNDTAEMSQIDASFSTTNIKGPFANALDRSQIATQVAHQVSSQRQRATQMRVDEPSSIYDSPPQYHTQTRNQYHDETFQSSHYGDNSMLPTDDNKDVSYIPLGIENDATLDKNFKNMLTFDLETFEEASNYFQDLCRIGTQKSYDFICKHANRIVKVFIEVCATIFEEGINYDLERTSYELIFVPLQNLFSTSGFLVSLSEDILSSTVSHILFRLVISNEEKTYFNRNGETEQATLAEFITKQWNSLMLRVIEYAEPNGLIKSLMESAMNISPSDENPVQKAAFNLSMRCLSKVSKNIKNIIQRISPVMIFQLVHEYISFFGLENTDSIESKTVNSLINELVLNTDFQDIWTYYDQVFSEDEGLISKLIMLVQQKSATVEMTQMIQECEAIGTEAAACQLIERYEQIRTFFPDFQMSMFADHFQDAHFFEKIMNEVNSYSMNQSVYSKPRTNRNQTVGKKPARQNLNQSRKPIDSFNRGYNDSALNRSEISQYTQISDIPDQRGRRRAY